MDIVQCAWCGNWYDAEQGCNNTLCWERGKSSGLGAKTATGASRQTNSITGTLRRVAPPAGSVGVIERFHPNVECAPVAGMAMPVRNTGTLQQNAASAASLGLVQRSQPANSGWAPIIGGTMPPLGNGAFFPRVAGNGVAGNGVAQPAPARPGVGVPAAQVYELSFWRGENNIRTTSNGCPPPEIRLCHGMTSRKPGWGKTVEERFRKMISDIQHHQIEGRRPPGPEHEVQINAYAQTLRQTGKLECVATARTTGGAFDREFFYELRIPNLRLFYFTPDYGIGAPAPFGTVESINAHYIVLNANCLRDATIMGFGHHAGTCEVTFFTDIPRECVVSCTIGVKKEKRMLSELNIISDRSQIEDTDERIKWSGYFRD